MNAEFFAVHKSSSPIIQGSLCAEGESLSDVWRRARRATARPERADFDGRRAQQAAGQAIAQLYPQLKSSEPGEVAEKAEKAARGERDENVRFAARGVTISTVTVSTADSAPIRK